MSLPIAPIHQIQQIPLIERVTPNAAPSEPGAFQAILNQSVQAVEQTRTTANTSIDRFLSGEGEELHRVAMMTQQAELTFDLFMQVRNKVVSAYQEVMRMQV
ncbi:MAG: flagellar hook-basal body complex protein FliE [Acidobacteria bacterium]|nr:flagellar hook-basal body complex protein FliE [Acidobacteriota bacterium]